MGVELTVLENNKKWPLISATRKPESEFWKPAEKSSLWTSSLNKLHWDRILFFFKDHETPEKLSSTEALQVPQRATPNLTFDLLEGNSRGHEVDEHPEVTRSKQVVQLVYQLVYQLFNNLLRKSSYFCFCLIINY